MWAFYTIYLATVLGQSVYGEFIFLQITAAFAGQILVGSFLNISAFEMSAAPDFDAALKIFLRSNLYVAMLGAATVPIIILCQILHLMPGSYLTAVAIAALTVATAMGGQVVAFACSQNAYRIAASLGVTSLALYVGGCTFLRNPNALSVIAAVFLAQSAPFILSVLWLSSTGRIGLAGFLDRRSLGALFRQHRDALATNLSSLPQQFLIWIMARNLMSFGGPAEFSRYGIANQINNLFLFFPTSFAPMFITWIGKDDRLVSRIRISLGMAGAFSSLGLVAAAGVMVALNVHPVYIPHEFLAASGPMTIALIMAGLVAARSPFAWINQINRDYRAEWIISLGTAACMAISLVPAYSDNSEALLFIRTAAALAGLCVSIALLFLSARRNGLRV